MIAVYSSYFGKEPEVIDKNYEGADISISYDSDSKLLSLTDLKPTTTIEGINATDDQFFEFTVNINKKPRTTSHIIKSILSNLFLFPITTLFSFIVNSPLDIQIIS